MTRKEFFSDLRVVMLAGGRGERMGGLTDNQQKCMMVVDGKPILEHGLLALRDSLFPPKVIIATGYLGKTIWDYFDHDFHGLRIEYIHMPAILGSRGRLLTAEKSCREPFLAIQADTVVSPRRMV